MISFLRESMLKINRQNQDRRDTLIGLRQLGSMAAVLSCLLPSLWAQTPTPQARPHNSAAEAKLPFSTGPEVGQQIPAFRALDQNGKMQDFNSIRGPKGAMVVFFRSADW
jgi:hypothetical protein